MVHIASVYRLSLLSLIEACPKIGATLGLCMDGRTKEDLAPGPGCAGASRHAGGIPSHGRGLASPAQGRQYGGHCNGMQCSIMQCYTEHLLPRSHLPGLGRLPGVTLLYSTLDTLLYSTIYTLDAPTPECREQRRGSRMAAVAGPILRAGGSWLYSSRATQEPEIRPRGEGTDCIWDTSARMGKIQNMCHIFLLFFCQVKAPSDR
jgi:hypothetical protein